MSDSNGKGSKSIVSVQPQGRVPRPPTSQFLMAELCRGLKYIAAFWFNPDWDTGSAEDRWYCVIPVGGTTLIIKTEMRGYTQKADLNQMSLLFVNQPERAVLSAVESLPQVEDVRKAKSISLMVPLMVQSSG
jgi:hypothetical protein